MKSGEQPLIYIGKTCRHLATRESEHIKNYSKNSAIGKHRITENHNNTKFGIIKKQDK